MPEHYKFKEQFSKFYKEHDIENFMNNVLAELSKIGWPEESNPIDWPEFKEILTKSSNIRIRLISIHSKLKSNRDDLKKIYDNILFFLKSDPETKGKTKEDKKQYAELELREENFILDKMNKIIDKITNLSEAYKIKYDSTSRVLSIVEYERKQTGREN